MRYLIMLSLVGLLLGACGPAPAPNAALPPLPASTPTIDKGAAPTTPSQPPATAPAVASVTTPTQGTAQALSTAIAPSAAQRTATALAQETATAQSVSAKVDLLMKGANKAYQLADGLAGGRSTSYQGVRCYNTNVYLKNFVFEARYFNPSDGKVNPWDYGFVFRESGRNRQYWLAVNWDANWSLAYPKLNPDGSVQSMTTHSRGVLPNLDTSPTGSNLLRAIVNDQVGYFFVNNRYISTLDISEKTDQGNVGLCTAISPQHDFPGLSVRVKDATIWSLP